MATLLLRQCRLAIIWCIVPAKWRLTSEMGQTRPSDDLGRMSALALLSGHGRITA